MRALALYVLIILFLYIGFSLVEAGVMHIQGKEPDFNALRFDIEDNVVLITFAGDLYEVDLTEVHTYFTRLLRDKINLPF